MGLLGKGENTPEKQYNFRATNTKGKNPPFPTLTPHIPTPTKTPHTQKQHLENTHNQHRHNYPHIIHITKTNPLDNYDRIHITPTTQRQGHNTNMTRTTKSSLETRLQLVIFVVTSIALCITGALFMLNSQHNTITTFEESTRAQVVTLGDSTMALVDGKPYEYYRGCRHDEGAWPSLIDSATNLSCGGAKADKVASIAKSTPSLNDQVSHVLITAGSNSLRYGDNIQKTESDLTDIIMTVKKKAPNADILLVGYTRVDGFKCLRGIKKELAVNLDYEHDVANSILEKVSKEQDVDYLPVTDLHSQVCNEQEALITVPGIKEGVSWHTTARGHELIAQKVSEKIGVKTTYDIAEAPAANTQPDTAYNEEYFLHTTRRQHKNEDISPVTPVITPTLKEKLEGDIDGDKKTKTTVSFPPEVDTVEDANDDSTVNVEAPSLSGLQ